jgi:hypothetical protein
VTSDLPPGLKQRLWSPISATLISGARDAVLADALMTTGQARSLADWIAASGTIESLQPRAVVADHKRPGRADDRQIVGETRRYIRDFDRIANTTSTAYQLYEQMLALYPAPVNPGALWSSARALKP